MGSDLDGLGYCVDLSCSVRCQQPNAMKYTIRRMPDVPTIDSAHWAIWRPGMYEQPFRGFRSFETANSLHEALSKVNADIVMAMMKFSELTGESQIDIVEAIYWHCARTRNDWRESLFSYSRTDRKSQMQAVVAAPVSGA